MKLRFAPLVAALAGGLLLSSCVFHGGHHGGHSGYGKKIVVTGGHAHSAHCGHYYQGGSWYKLAHHTHGPRCGHYFKGGIWIVR